MLATKDWLGQYFDHSTDAIFIFKDDALLVQNQMAKELEQELEVDPMYLLQVADTSVKQKYSQTNGCFNCIIQNKMTNLSVPLTLTDDSTHPLHYFMVYSILDKTAHLFSITLKSRGTINRMDQLAQQRKLTRYVNRAHELERKRISEDLHDSIAQGIYSAIIGIRRLRNADLSTEQLTALSNVIENQLDDTLKEVKGMALDIRPSVLDNFGLLPALKVLANRLEENSGVTIEVAGKADTSVLSEDVQSVLYRIAQEAINNALKHANASEITVLLVNHQHFIILEIIDDGDGFDVPSHQSFNGRSLGLLNMSERVKALNGTFNIKSKLHDGTTVTAKFPVADLGRKQHV